MFLIMDVSILVFLPLFGIKMKVEKKGVRSRQPQVGTDWTRGTTPRTAPPSLLPLPAAPTRGPAFLTILIGCAKNCSPQASCNHRGKWERGFGLGARPRPRPGSCTGADPGPRHHSLSSQPPPSPALFPATRKRRIPPWHWRKAAHTLTCAGCADHVNNGSWKSDLLLIISWEGSVHFLRAGPKPTGWK